MHEQRSSTEWTNYWSTKKSKSRELCARVPLSNKTTSLSPKKSLLQISSLPWPYTRHTCKFGYWATRGVGTFGLFPGLCQWGPFLCHTPVYAQPSCDSLQCAYTTNQEKVKIADAQLPWHALACLGLWPFHCVALVPCIKTHHVWHLKLSRALTKTDARPKSTNSIGKDLSLGQHGFATRDGCRALAINCSEHHFLIVSYRNNLMRSMLP